MQRFDTGIIQVDHALLVAFAEQPDLPLFQVDVAKVHPDQFCQTHPAVQKQHDHAVIPFREIALMLGAFQ